MIEDAFALARSLARKHYARWSKFDDALSLLKATDDGGRSSLGERARRLLGNSRCVSNYPEDELSSLDVDRANALRKLQKPLSEALGHLVTLELIDLQEQGVKATVKKRSAQQSELIRDGHYREHRPLIDALHELGIAHGHYSVLSDEEYRAIARYVRRKVEQRVAGLPPLRSGRETHGPDGRRHSFWDPYHLRDRREK